MATNRNESESMSSYSHMHANGTRQAVSSGSIAIVGMSGRYPGGANTPELLWDLLKSGVDAVGEAKGDRWDLGWHHPGRNRQGRVYTRAGGFLDRIDEFDAEFFGLSPREARQMDPQQRLLLELAWEAFEDAGIAPRGQAGSNTGVFVGISSNDYASLTGPGYSDAYSNTGSSFSIAANRISYIFDLHGPSVAVDTACSSSLVCAHQACTSLLAGECSMALAGGVSLLVDIRAWLGFARASMLSPTGRCRSFDAGGDGYVRSEGGGLALLKPLAAAERDGDRILGVILASGVNSDGRTMGLSMPNGEAQESLLRQVYSRCGVPPEDVFYVEAHGPGTGVGDPIECGAVGRVLGSARGNGSRCLIGSVKSNIGHLEAASGMAGLAKVLLSLRHREIPGNLHFNQPNPKIDFENWKLEVVTKATPLPERDRPIVIGINSFGFGGTNAHVAIREYRPPAARPASSAQAVAPQPGLLAISGQSAGALTAVARAYADLLRGQSADAWQNICAAAATCRSPLRHRLAVHAATAGEAVERLERYLAGQPAARLATGEAAAPAAPVAFVYSGNGPQWWGMGRELLAENAAFREEIEAIDAIFAPLAGWSLIEEMRRPEAESRMERTEIAQPVLFAEQLGLTKVLRQYGIEPGAVVGHSVGEVAAACACGALSREQATRVIFHRSMEQARTKGLGRMAALGVSPEEARAAIEATPGWLELAAANSPQAVTVAGERTAVEQLVNSTVAAGKFARVLPLDYPFHTKAMDGIRAGLLHALRDLAPAQSAVPFISTVAGEEQAGQALDAEYWFRNVRQPVRFHEAISCLIRDTGIAVFLEIGPHPVLKDYISQTAKGIGVPVTALPTLRRPGQKGPEPESDNLWTAVCACHANGAGRLDRLFTKPNPIPALPLYPWQRTRHWRGMVSLPDVPSAILRDHPLLGHRIPSSDGIWENTLDTNQHAYLQDHVVQNAVVFPAAGYIELALAAGRLLLGEGVLDVENFEVLRPLAIPAHGDPVIQTLADGKDGVVEIRSRPERDATEFTAHARGRLSRADSGAAEEGRNLGDISAHMPCSLSKEEHYRGASDRDLDYGPWFQGVNHVLLTAPDARSREALAEIDLPALDAGQLEKFLSHPALLDCCLQVLVTLIGQNEKRNCCTIPVQIGRVRSFAPLTGRMFCHVTMRRESERSAVADFCVMDPAGTPLLTIDEARCQKVDFRQAAASPRISEWWRPDTSVAAPAPLAPLPSPSENCAAAMETLARIQRETGRAQFYREIRPALDELAGAYAAQAIAQLQPGEGSFDVPRLARKGNVKHKQTSLLAKLVRMAGDDGQLGKVNASWRWNRERTPAQPETVWRRIFQNHPRYQAELQLLAQAGDNLAAALQGEEPGDRAPLLDQLQDTSPFQLPYNQMMRAGIEKLVAAWPAERPMRILEIGGSGGSLAAWVLPVLPAERADYLFTDPSEAALGRAQHRLSAHRFVRFATLNLEQDFVEQGQPAGYFDLAIAAHALGSVEDPRALLKRLMAVMAPDGQVRFLQANQDRFTDLVLGQRAASWAEELVEAGFEEVVALDDFAACPAGQTVQQSILAARKMQWAGISEEVSDTVAARRWMLIAEPGDGGESFAQHLAAMLMAACQNVATRWFSGSEAERKEHIAEALEREPVDEIVYLAAAGADGRKLLETETQRCSTAANLVQALESSRQGTPCQLTFVTRGAFPTGNGQGPIEPGQAPLWGLGRVIGNEHPALGMRMIDLHSAGNCEEEVRRLAAELLRRDAETEVQLSAGHRYVNRARMTGMAGEARGTGAAPEFALDFLPQGGLDSLHLRALERKEPGPGEVEIAVKAAGLNFRDVLWTMGMLPEEAVEEGFSGAAIGMECAGEIARVGAGVTGVKPGDRVVAFASFCFSSHVTTAADSVAHIPNGIDFASAATIPTAFLTAYYALDYLARLQPGETVLIHGAAGGVGMAAVQVAKLKGAKIIGTAGSARKRRMLEMLGVDHVLNSRSLEFADHVKKITGGVGVDVVLNSLAGEAITKSLQCLRPFGRFLEIGKRDLYANSRIGLRPFRHNLSYFGIDADTLLIERADLARSIFQTVMEHFETGALQPLPFQAVPVSRAAEAFRSMQQSRHVGKLVVSMELDKPESLAIIPSGQPVKPGATYLVTGGLGGFGLATARWLVEQGATSLALIGRRGAETEEAAAGVAQLEKMGAAVRAFAADIADAGSLAKVLATIRAEMAPLKGVIHSAAVIEDAPVMNLTAAQIERVFAPKLLGAWNLHEATRGDALEMFVLYSSSSAVVGNPGQGAYVAANLYLDSLALYRKSLGLPALSVGWGAIKDAGFLTRHRNVADMLKTRSGLDATPAREALADLGRLCQAGATRVSVARFDLSKLGQMLPGARVPRFLPIVPKNAAASLQAEETLAELVKKTPEGERRELVLARVREHGARVLGSSASQISVDEPLANLGLDSLMAVELAGGLERDLGQPVSVMQMLSAGSLRAIAELALKMLGARSEEAIAPKSASSADGRAELVGKVSA